MNAEFQFSPSRHHRYLLDRVRPVLLFTRKVVLFPSAVITLSTLCQSLFAEEMPDIAGIQRNHRVENLQEAGVLLADVRPEKLSYRVGDEVKAVARLVNTTPQVADVQVRIWLEYGLGEAAGHQERTVQVPPDAMYTAEFVWPAGTASAHGNAVATELRQGGKLMARGRDVFSCTENIWEMAIGALPNGPAANSANYTEDQILGQVHGWRDQYCNVWEKYFWAPDDWGKLTMPPGATWFSGQARRHENTEKLKLHIDASHAAGIAVVTYGKCMAGGRHGWEMARAKPQWFPTDINGRTMGRPADVWDLEHWQEADKYAYTDYKYVWTYRWVDLRRLDALDYGIDQLIASTRQFGWDGVRFDSGGFRAHFVDGQYNGNDIVNLRNMKRTKKRLWKEYPKYLFGFNTNNTASSDNRAYPLAIDDMSREMREMLAGGGLWMGEAIKHFANGGVTYKTWSEFATDERRCVQAVREAGGHFCYLYATSTVVRNLYQFVIGLMIGAHPYGGEHVGLSGSDNWGAFMTRWGGLFWDSRLRPVDVDDAGIEITADQALWWREFANERILGRDRRQVIIHLLNPPVDDEIANVLNPVPKDVMELVTEMDQPKAAESIDDQMEALLNGEAAEVGGELPPPRLSAEVVAAARAQRLPSPVAGATVQLQIPNGQKVRSVWFVAPGSPNRAMPADWRAEQERLVVDVPEFAVWAMIVCELEGQFAETANSSRLAVPLTPAETAELARTEPRPVNPIPWFGMRPPAPTPNVPLAEAGPETVWTEFGEREQAAPEGSVPTDLTIGGAEGLDALIVNGFYHGTYRVVESAQTVEPAARLTTCTTRDLPGAVEALAAFDTVVLVNMPATAWKPEEQQALADYVLAGGRLVILGGPFTLGQGDFSGTVLEALLPVRLLPGPDVYALPTPLPIGPKSGSVFPGEPCVYYVHAARPVDNAAVSVWAGDWPLTVEHGVGKGSVAVFLGTPLGEQKDREAPFWQSEVWLQICGKMMAGAVDE